MAVYIRIIHIVMSTISCSLFILSPASLCIDTSGIPILLSNHTYAPAYYIILLPLPLLPPKDMNKQPVLLKLLISIVADGI